MIQNNTWRNTVVSLSFVTVCLPVVGACSGSDTQSSSTNSNASAGTGSATATASSSTGAGGQGSGGMGGAGGGTPQEHVSVITPEGAPIANAALVLADATGAFITSATTDAQGKATITLPAGGSISFVDPDQRKIESIVDPPIGSPIVLVRTWAAFNSQQKIDVPISYAAPLAGATKARFQASCGTIAQLPIVLGGTSGSYSKYQGCPGEPTFSMFAVAVDAQGAVVGFGHKDNIAFGATASALGVPLDSSTIQHINVSMSTVPAPAAFYGIDLTSLVHGDVGIAYRATETTTPMTMSSFDLTWPSTSFFDEVRVEQVFSLDPVGKLVRRRYDGGATLPTSVVWNPTTPGLPDVSAPPTFSSSPVVPFTLVAAGKGDFVLLDLQQEDTASTYIEWFVLAKPDAGQVAIPQLPATFSTLRFSAFRTDEIISDVDVDSAQSFADVVASGFGLAAQGYSLAQIHEAFNP